ncbi:MAG: hypothetical protein CVU47_08620 [Chloroflexi bacterium HGW-Chloroflexi-9]|nr:MAG: hypothetical protein CVU47_08620 [Chloroflexi bacterium HGW-Chloroflexi-9]
MLFTICLVWLLAGCTRSSVDRDVEEQALRIETAVSLAWGLSAYFALVDLGDDYQALGATLRSECEKLPVMIEQPIKVFWPSVHGLTVDQRALWPRPYLDVDASIPVLCSFVVTPVSWNPGQAAAVVQDLNAQLAALPDYSPAQLRRALKDRQ